MKRWLWWFAAGFALFVLALVGSVTKSLVLGGIGGLAIFLFLAWVALTFCAVPIGVIYWLVRGRRSAS